MNSGESVVLRIALRRAGLEAHNMANRINANREAPMSPHQVSKKSVQSAPPSTANADPALAAGLAAGTATTRLEPVERLAKTDVRRSRENLVMLMMGLVTVAFVTGLALQFGYSVLASILGGAVLWGILLGVNAVSRKSEQLEQMSVEVSRLEGEISRLKGTSVSMRARAGDTVGYTTQSPDAVANIATEPARPAPHKSDPLRAVPASDASLAQGNKVSDTNIGASLTIEPQARWEEPKSGSKVRLAAPTKVLASESPLAPMAVRPITPVPSAVLGSVHVDRASQIPPSTYAQPHDASWPGTSVSASDPMRDVWAFRPKDAPAAPAFSTQSEAPLPTASGGQTQTIDRELEIVQRKIKALAYEVNAAETIKAQASIDAAHVIPSALDHSISALKATSVRMHDRVPVPQLSGHQAPTPAIPASPRVEFASADFFIPATAERIAVSDLKPEANNYDRDVYLAPHLDTPYQPRPQSVTAQAPDPHLVAITHAIKAGNIDVFLSPIVALKDHAVSHYEVVVRLRSTSGEHFDRPEQSLELAGSEIVGLFDSARLTRSAALAERLEARGKTGSVLSSITGQSMTDGGFLETFARVYEERQSISGQLVLTLSQADLAQFTPSAWQAIGDMHAFGFRFALEGVEHFDTDFDTLARHGFDFIKLPAEAFIRGLPSMDGFIPAHEICRMLAKIGLTLVADAIDSDEVRARVFGFGVLFGQGQLFGGARAMNIEPPASKHTAAA